MDISALASSQNNHAMRMFNKIDTDSSGGINKEEFVAGRPDDISEEMASSHFDTLDTSSSGILNMEQIAQTGRPAHGNFSPEMSQSFLAQQESSSSSEGLNSSMSVSDSSGTRPPPPPPPPSSSSSEESDELSLIEELLAEALEATSDTDETSNISNIISKMDTNGDNEITKEEFVSARPEGVNEDMAESFWDQMDTEKTGSLSSSDLQTAMEENRPPPPPPQEGFGESSLSRLTAELKNAISSYSSALNYESEEDLTSSLLTTI